MAKFFLLPKPSWAHLERNAWHTFLRSRCTACSSAEVLLNPVGSLGRWRQCWLCNSQPCYWQARCGNYNLPSGPVFRGGRKDGIPLFGKRNVYVLSSYPNVWLDVFCAFFAVALVDSRAHVSSGRDVGVCCDRTPSPSIWWCTSPFRGWSTAPRSPSTSVHSTRTESRVCLIGKEQH